MTWTKEQDIITFYLYRPGIKISSAKAEEIRKTMQIEKKTSLRRRIDNFKYLDGIGTQSHFVQMTKEVFDEHKNLSLEELEQLASKILSDHSRR
ncbi:MAG: hypothetical protein KF734_02520 [Saprospiraceae bacterium]|nr:hypothetical protein [Saprospiraceae bacterium]